MPNFNYLTSLRGLAAIWVVFYHIEYYLKPHVNDTVLLFVSKGYLAVDFFFLLSGFIIMLNYGHKLEGLNVRIYFTFLAKRLARIYPLHLFILLAYLSTPFLYWLTERPFPSGDRFSVDNFFLHLALLNNWSFSTELSWNIPAWSISTEWAAYIVFPIIAWIVNKLNKGSLALPFIILPCVLFIIFYSADRQYLGEDIQKLGVYRCIVEFFIGCALCKLSKEYVFSNKIAYLVLFFGFMGTFLVFWGYLSEIAYAASLLTIMIFSFVSLHSSWLSNLLNTKVLMFLGEISYSIYLVHYFIKDVFKMAFLSDEYASITWILGYFITVIFVSVVTYHVVENPARRYLNSKIPRPLLQENKV